MSESVQLEGVDQQQVGLVIEAAEREIDAMLDLDLEGTDQYLDAFKAVNEAYSQIDN